MGENIKKAWDKLGVFDKYLAVVVVVGLFVTLFGLVRGVILSSRVSVEYVDAKTETKQAERSVIVDIGGAVLKPGVYNLVPGSRIKDVVVMAGGFSEKADRNYVDKSINLAQVLKDGQKLYIPFLSDTPAVLGYSEAESGSNMINVNSASLKELDTLWGIGEARAESIVKNRPYSSLEEMVEKKAITSAILEKNRERMTVY